MRFRSLLAGFGLAIALTSAALAQAVPKSAPIGIGSGATTTAAPVTITDGAGQRVTLGTLDSTKHFFTPANVLPLAGGTMTGNITANATGGYWSSGQGIPAMIHRFNDRVFIGQATNYAGDATDTNETWLSTTGKTIYSYLERNAQLYVNSSVSEMAAVFAARSGDSAKVPGNSGSSCCAMALAGVALNDNTSTVQAMWDMYLTGVRLPGTGHMLNEIDILNATPTVTRASAYGFDTSTMTTGLWVMSGGEGASYNQPPGYPAGTTPYANTSNSTLAMYVGNNGTQWDKGIVFGNGAIGQQADGSLVSMELAANQRIAWSYDSSGKFGGFMDSEVTQATSNAGLSFTNAGAFLWSYDHTATYLGVATGTGGVNYPYLKSATGGGNVVVSATGADTNVNLELAMKGTGKLLIDGSISLSGTIQGPFTTPSSSSAACTAGTFELDSGYLYVCAAANRWRRAQIVDF